MVDPVNLKAFYDSGELKRPTVALRELQQNPEQFLKTYPISIDEAQDSGVRTAYLRNGRVGWRPGSKLGTLNMHKTQEFIFSLSQPEGHAFQCQYVRMDPSDQAIQWYALAPAPDVMLTCKLTGCSFVVRQNGPNVEVAHLQPKQETGLELNQRLLTGGQKAFGRLKYDLEKRQAHVVAVRRGGTWEVYAQKVDKAKEVGIRSVKKIWP
ncbi:MAG TPA: hypothetical protein VF950_00780 [Planctomycetota bacterium]